MKTMFVDHSKIELMIGDITKQKTDAVVNAANKQLAPGGGVAGAIHRAAGPQLWEACKTLGGCKTGEAKITNGYQLPASYIIHTVGPVYSNSPQDPEHLATCYRNSLKLTQQHNLKSIAFPALSTGYFGYPFKDAARIALKTVIDELENMNGIELVRFVLFDTKALEVFERVADELN
jgi:O-acetyl-ADP-ribose deacetylase (regulator of RNase III)